MPTNLQLIGCTDGEVLVYDILPSAVTTKLRNAIVYILHTSKTIIITKYIDVQMQDGARAANRDIFANVFAATKASVGKPSVYAVIIKQIRGFTWPPVWKRMHLHPYL